MGKAAFVTVDVFTQERFSGNPLAVFPDARGISDDAMQKIAAEFGYSEITFVLPPQDPAHDARVRIFTPTAEIPFAGHPNVGTAFVLGQESHLFGRAIGDVLRFEEKAGLVEVVLEREEAAVVGATIRAPQPLTVGEMVPPEIILSCASLPDGAVRVDSHPPRVVSVGLPFVVAELSDLASLARARPNLAAFGDAAKSHGPSPHDFSLFLYVRDSADPWHLRARMFAPLDNVLEDPATGSASGALSAFLADLDSAPDGAFHLTIEQGVEMGRRSLIAVTVDKLAGAVQEVRIGGRCVSVMEGHISV
ncbi:PhzF family phenazine biosynthesis protein [Neorhizobium galegae]|uniref:PhzF family phenazine biosynthesis protein n=1 Tax=Neorhizobium galegae TaxID=399 RepID=UPI001AE629EE|nr:PhzF family phenazine biosynthesis protein [Neorhizobium galegae]